MTITIDTTTAPAMAITVADPGITAAVPIMAGAIIGPTRQRRLHR